MRICGHPGCGVLTDKAKCIKHTQAHKWADDKERGNRHQRGYGVQWERIRKQVLMRDGYLCQVCKRAGKPRAANEVDHITPKAKGGTDDLNNLQAICGPCHKRKTAQEKGRGRETAGCDEQGTPLDKNHPWNQ